MKALKYILSITLVALTTLSIGQRSYVIEELFPEEEPRPYFANDREAHRSRIEIWKHDLRNMISEKVTWNVYDHPVVAHSFYVEKLEVIYEEELGVEKWMKTPFELETGVGEEELHIESWMTVPFEIPLEEKEITLESWMTVPFYEGFFEEPLAVEAWMTRPFTALTAEEELNVEPWMTIPFDIPFGTVMDECMADARI